MSLSCPDYKIDSVPPIRSSPTGILGWFELFRQLELELVQQKSLGTTAMVAQRRYGLLDRVFMVELRADTEPMPCHFRRILIKRGESWPSSLPR